MISPIPHLEDFGDFSSFHMVLGHLCGESSEYEAFYRRHAEHGDDLLVDNSSNEFGDPRYFSSALESALRLSSVSKGRVTVVLPDTPMNREKTVVCTGETLKLLSSDVQSRVSFMAVVQGETEYELGRCFREYQLLQANSPYTFSLAVPYDAPGGRSSFVRVTTELGASPVHLLGLSSLCELPDYSTCFDRVTALDTCYPVLCGLHGIDLRQTPLVEKPSYDLDFHRTQRLTSSQVEIAKWNICYILELMSFVERQFCSLRNYFDTDIFETCQLCMREVGSRGFSLSKELGIVVCVDCAEEHKKNLRDSLVETQDSVKSL